MIRFDAADALAALILRRAVVRQDTEEALLLAAGGSKAMQAEPRHIAALVDFTRAE